MTYAVLAANHRGVLCGRCRTRLGDLDAAVGDVPIIEHGGPVTDSVAVATDQRVLRLIEGYQPREPDGVWRLGNHARKRLIHDQDGRFSHGRVRLGVVDYPARVACYRCGLDRRTGAERLCLIDPHRLGLRVLPGGVLVALER